MVGNVIADQFRGIGSNWPLGAALAFIVMASVMGVYLVITRMIVGATQVVVAKISWPSAAAGSRPNQTGRDSCRVFVAGVSCFICSSRWRSHCCSRSPSRPG